MIANLGASALEATQALERALFKDRTRRDFNESLIAAQDAINLRQSEAMASNDPRTMLRTFNSDIERDLSAIRERITVPSVRSDFDLRINSTLHVARGKVLADQLSLERQESRAQFEDAARSLTRSVAQDTSNENLTRARDLAKDMTDHAIETGALTPYQGKIAHQTILSDIEKLAVSALVKANRHKEAIDRLQRGDFRSFDPTKIPEVIGAIRADMQRDNFQDLWYQIRDGGASHALEAQIRQMDATEDLSHKQARDLIAMNAKIVDEKVDKMAKFDAYARYLNREPGSMNPDDPKALEDFTIEVLDKLIAADSVKMREQGYDWTDVNTMESQAHYVDLLDGQIPKSWESRAIQRIMSLETQSADNVVAAAMLLDVAAKRKPGFYEGLSGDFKHAGQRAQMIADLKAKGFGHDEIVNLVQTSERQAESADVNESSTKWSILSAKENYARESLGKQLAELDFTLQNGVTIQDYVQKIGMRQGYFGIGQPTGFAESESELTYLQEHGQIAPITALMTAVQADALPEGFAEIEGELIYSRPTIGLLNKFKHIFQGDMTSIIVPHEMVDQYEELVRMEYLANGAQKEAAEKWAMGQILNVWHPTQYEGPPRWARGTIEEYYPPVNGSWDWTREQLKEAMRTELMDTIHAYKAAGGSTSWLDDIPEFTDTITYEQWERDVWQFMAWASERDPKASIEPGEIPRFAWDEANWKMLELAEFGGTLDKFFANPFGLFGDFGIGTPEIRSWVTSESERRRDPETGRPAPGRYLQYRGKDGGFHNLSDLLFGNPEAYEFQYDVRQSKEWQEQHRKDLLSYARAVVLNHARLGLSREQTEQRLKLAEQDDPVRLQGLGDIQLFERFRLHDPTIGLFEERQPGGLGQGLATGADFVPSAPPFDYETRKRQIRRERFGARSD